MPAPARLRPPAEALASADAAIVGRLLGVAPRGATQADYRYEVLRVYRGRGEIEPGETLTVLQPARLGRLRAAQPDRPSLRPLPARRRRDRWASGLCGVVSPRRLWSAAQQAGGGSGQHRGS